MKILLIDDHKLFAKSIKVILESDKNIDKTDIVSEIDDSLIDKIKKEKYDIILVDININNIAEQSGLDLAKLIISKNTNSKILILTGYNRVMYEIQAINMGAYGFIDKNIEPNKLIEIIKQTNKGLKYFKYEDTTEYKDTKTDKKLIRNNDGTFHIELTPQEVKILKLLKLGDNIDIISEELNISKRTVSNHINNIYSKLYVSNRQSAILEADKLGYFTPDLDI